MRVVVMKGGGEEGGEGVEGGGESGGGGGGGEGEVRGEVRVGRGSWSLTQASLHSPPPSPQRLSALHSTIKPTVT